MNIVNNYASTIMQIYNDVIRTYENDLEVIKQAEDELCDLNHEAELSSPKDMYQGYLIYKNIRETRIRRRTAKEEVELLKDMYEFFKSQQGQAFKSKIQQLQGNSAKIRAVQESRTYQPRQRDDLTITDKHSEANKPFQELLDEFNKNKAYIKGGKLRR